tara:strand:- start:883 stop:1065 length:183 start_codon:yes stop_codon:yes gene_type:complete
MMNDEENMAYSENDLAWARQIGAEAYLNGARADDNPYNNNDEWELNRAWVHGYFDAAWND